MIKLQISLKVPMIEKTDTIFGLSTSDTARIQHLRLKNTEKYYFVKCNKYSCCLKMFFIKWQQTTL